MNFWKVILATLVIFVAGVVTGGLLVNYSDRTLQKVRRFQPRENVRQPANPNLPPGAMLAPNARDPRQPNLPNRLAPGLNLEFVQKLDGEVQLSPEQRDHIQKIIADGQQHNKELWKRIAPELREENARTKERIRNALTPEQRVRFDELMKQPRPTGRRPDDSAPPNVRRDQRRPIPPRDAPAPESPQPAPPGNP